MDGRPQRAGVVGLLGRSNVGKSSLVNRIVGGRVAITVDRPQTTRRAIRGIRTYVDENAQLVLIDAPGLHRSNDLLSDTLLERAYQAVRSSDATLCLVEAGDRAAGATQHVLEALPEDVVSILVVTKVDRHPREVVLRTLDEIGAAHPFRARFAVSSETGDGTGELEKALIALLPEREFLYPATQVTDQSREERVAEIVREKLFLTLRDEVPHAAHVEVTELAERPGKTLSIACTIYVERPSQKGIVIGKGGAQIKRIGELAREEIEFVSKHKVYLKTDVKVKPAWRQNAGTLRQFGLG